MRATIKCAALAAFLILPVTGLAQYQPWAVQWLQHAYNAQAGREYLGIYGTSGTNYVPGANVTFTLISPYTYRIAAAGGGGAFVPAGTGFFHATAGVQDAAAQLVTLTAGTDVAVNQGTTTTVLHGDAFGLPTWGAVNLATDVAGILPGASVSGVWHLAGDALGAPGSFLGSTDNQALQFRMNNVAVGEFTTGNAIQFGQGAVASGANSVAIGPQDGISTTTASGTDAAALGAGSTASGDYSFALGTFCQSLGVNSIAVGVGANANVDGSFALGNAAAANGINSVVIGFNASTLNSGSFVISDGGGGAVNDTATDQFVAGFFGGSWWTTYGFGMTIDEGDGVGLVALTNGAVFAKSSIATNIFTGTTIHSNVVYVGCVTNVMNGIAGYPTTTTNVPIRINPVGPFGYMAWYGTATIDFTATLYTNIWVASGTTPTRVLTNSFGYNSSLMTLTNHIAGYYSVKFGITFDGGALLVGDDVEADLIVTTSTGVEIAEDHISSHATGVAAGTHWAINGGGRIYLAALSRVQLKAKSNASDDAAMIRAFLDVGP